MFISLVQQLLQQPKFSDQYFVLLQLLIIGLMIDQFINNKLYMADQLSVISVLLNQLTQKIKILIDMLALLREEWKEHLDNLR